MVDFFALMIPAMVPFLLAAQGTILAGRVGVFSVAQEGIMVLGASVGFLVSLKLGGNNLAGILAAAAIGALFGLILGYATAILRLDQFVVGLGSYFAALGIGSLLYRAVIGTTLEPPLIETLQKAPVPGLSQIPFVGEIFFNHDLLVYFAFVVSFAIYWFMYRTNAGLKFRSIGENPKSADSVGIKVTATKIWATIIGMALVGVAGAYLPMAYTGIFTEGIVAGRGWIVIALAFLAGWRPHLAVAGAAFFAGMEVLAFRAQVGGVAIPHQFVLMLPYLATIVVMLFAFNWSRQPKFLGINYDRESRLSG